MRLLPRSPRRRRRLAWTLGLLVPVVGAVGLAVVLIPGKSESVDSPLSDEPAQLVSRPRSTPLGAQDRREIGTLLTRFVNTAIRRDHPERAWELVTSGMHAGTTRAEWARGDVPVIQYEPRGTDFRRAWLIDYSYPGEVSVRLMLHPRRGKVDSVDFSVELKQTRSRWLISSIYPIATFAAPGTPPSVLGPNDFIAGGGGSPIGSGDSRVNRVWIVVPVAAVVGTLLFVVGFFVVSRVRDRRATAAFERTRRAKRA